MKLKRKARPEMGPSRFTRIQSLVEAVVNTYDLSDDPEILHLQGALASKSWGTVIRLADSAASKIHSSQQKHFAWNQVASLLRKVPFEDPSLDPEGTAKLVFERAEHKCRRMNQKFRAMARRENRGATYPNYSSLHFARRWIEKVIGSEPHLPSIFEKCGFGSGASLGTHGEATHTAAKLEGEWTVTPTCLPYALSAMAGDPHIWEYLLDSPFCVDRSFFAAMAEKRFCVVTNNKITMVPKTAKVHRTIAIEPLWNGYVQKGIDQVLRISLKRVGIDLSDQSKNQRFARIGSFPEVNDPFVTIDLSAASDSVSIGLCKLLLPPAWYALLMACRSPCFITDTDTAPRRFNKIASMGNGFCFPLETLIFSSLVHAVYDETKHKRFAVYGDDIIVHQGAALRLIELLNYVGFSTNTDKTFIFGPFRESCGADYFEGVDVRPYTLDFFPITQRDVFKVYNGMSRRQAVLNTPIHDEILSWLEPRRQFFRPIPGPEDTAITVPYDFFMAQKGKRWSPSIQAWQWRELLSIPVVDMREVNPSVMMYSVTRSARANENYGVAYTFRRRTRTHVRFTPHVP